MRTLRLVLGSFLVYLFVACASAISDNGVPPTASLDGSAPGSVDATSEPDDSTSPAATSSSSKESGAIGAIMDAISNPVGEANAQTVAPITATENCDKTSPYNDAGLNYVYAEHLFPGYSAIQLSAVRAVATYASSSVGIPPGYTQLTEAPWVRDGAVAVSCGITAGGTSPAISSVTFIMPQ